jgi:LDH2 family malate/lactate/ureidoglycolate dehydrogenase
MATRTVAVGELTERVARVFAALGLPEEDARIVADHLVEADLRGVHSHGVIRVPTYVQGIRAGRINPTPTVRVVEDHGGQAVMDGDYAMGHVAAYRANALAIERGREHGMAAVALRRSTHCGAMAYYAIRAREAGLIGLAITNAGMNMTPTGGTAKLIGNNPFAMAVPTTRAWPMVLDMATSVVAGGKLDVARSKGEPIPLGWARDKDGNRTTDPVAARAGSLEPLGGPKGYGMAVMLDVLAGVLSGGRFGGMLGDEAGRSSSSQFFLTLAVDRFMPVEQFTARMDAVIDQIQQSPRAPGVDRVYVAGEIEHELQARRRREGLPLEGSVLAALDAAASDVGA